jgi:DNA polymerase IIIc chi subunit
MTPEDKEDQTRASLAQLIKKAEEDRVLMKGLYQVQAVRARDRFKALKDAGFNDEQALNLCTKEISL